MVIKNIPQEEDAFKQNAVKPQSTAIFPTLSIHLTIFVTHHHNSTEKPFSLFVSSSFLWKYIFTRLI